MNEQKHDPLVESLEDLSETIRQQPSLKEKVMRRIIEQSRESHVGVHRPWWGQRSWGAIGALAACLAMGVIVWSVASGFDAQKAFAGALESVQFARTFSCTQVYEAVEKGQAQPKHSMRFMFKEPNRGRYEKLTASNGEEISIEDYRAKRRLDLQPGLKTASLADTSTMYTVDPVSGRLGPTRLNTDLREQILGWSSRSAQDLGMVTLNGQSARLLRSTKGDATIQVWLDPKTRLPMQIMLENPEHGWRWIYSGIAIDEPLDDSLFSVEPPADYKLFREGVFSPWSDHIGQIYAKMRFLSMKAWEYAGSHGNQFPKDLSDLASVGVSDELLRTVLAPEGRPEASPMIAYRQPRPDRDNGKEIMFYEIVDSWPSTGIAVNMADGHGEVIGQQSRFDELMK